VQDIIQGKKTFLLVVCDLEKFKQCYEGVLQENKR